MAMDVIACLVEFRIMGSIDARGDACQILTPLQSRYFE
jgi:hypothetical protein